VALYQAFEPNRHALVYYACTACIADPKRRARLLRWVEARARAADEDAGLEREAGRPY